MYTTLQNYLNPLTTTKNQQLQKHKTQNPIISIIHYTDYLQYIY